MSSGSASPRWWRRAVGRLAQSRSDDLPTVDLDKVDQIVTAELRQEVTLEGHLDALSYHSDGPTRGLTAEFSDGTGSILLVWLGRRAVPGMHPGRRLQVIGRITFIDRRQVMYNPRYTLYPS